MNKDRWQIKRGRSVFQYGAILLLLAQLEFKSVVSSIEMNYLRQSL